jgi:phosphoribosylglycinamide formyltransferase-1
MKRIAILASGSGSNAENIARYFQKNPEVEVVSILTNNPKAYVLSRAKNLNIESYTFNREVFFQSDVVLDYLVEKQIDFIVLAGFLWLIPENLIKAYPNAMVNIHPALLPKYGGKGMYGMNVHKSVVENGETESGITIHMVNEEYDEGKIVFQAKCNVTSNDSPEDVADKVHELEYEHYPKIIEQLL